MRAQPWIFSARFDSAFILAPALIVSLLAILLYEQAQALAETPLWLWVLLIVGVDVAHVYSTLFRSYFNRHELQARPALYTLAPLCAFVGGCMLYSIDALVFWRALAYLAVFHFVRQQYGFMMLYSRGEKNPPAWYKRIDKMAIYGATLFPLLYWHTHTRTFHWFVKGDFWHLPVPLLASAAGGLYILILLVYVYKEYCLWRKGQFNLPRNLLLLGTMLSWGIGIVLFDNDLLFTATNVIAHGIPYLALTWGYGRNEAVLNAPWWKPLFRPTAAPLYIGGLVLFAYLEEGLWDGLLWREHTAVFKAFQNLPFVHTPEILMWLVPLLALPQATHYILDAFLWRLHSGAPEWKRILFLEQKIVI
jgi:hypothetical protein